MIIKYMSIIATNPSINVGDTTTIIVSNLSNITFKEDISIISVEPSENNTYSAIVNPILTTIYYISAYTSTQTLVNLNVTVYVNITTTNKTVETNYGESITLNVEGSNSYAWYPNQFLNQYNESSVICTPLENITYKVIGVDSLLTKSNVTINVIVNSGLIFTPSNPTVYEGNLLKLDVTYNGSEYLEYEWKSYLFNNLPPNCVTYKYGDSIKINPYNNISYTVNGYYYDKLITSDKISINVIYKPSNIIDIDILPYNLSKIILNKNKFELKNILINNKILSKKIINFYYTTLQTAYRMEWTNKNGISIKVPWLTVYQINNETNEMILSFKQQWEFFKYINQNKGRVYTNFEFLLNILNEIYLETPQKIYITPL